ncbi:PREDICTED: trem-like transcript 2 protein [Myotis davidii]|uniref:trem-like transcript 2 protein n=1 Tax=Myotis davidii TaxID=225400 RepID=UPI0007672B2D|nr:PREDICTED: trem-like transcript 2 protein [Myotis davidii]
MAPTLLLLLLLLWLQGCVSGVPAESVYSKVQHFEGETLSVQCSYKNRKKHVEGKVWCKIRRKKCEPGFTRVWAPGPRYLLQDDAQAKVVNITMVALRRQDSGRYWCMRNSSGILYPLMGFQLEVSPVPTAERSTPLTQLTDILKSGVVVTTGHIPTSGPGAPFTTSVTMLTPGVLTLARLVPSPASGTIRLSSVTGYSFTSPSTPGPMRNKAQTVTTSPSNARASSAAPASVSTEAGPLRTTSPTMRMCRTSRSLLNKLSPIRPRAARAANPTVLAGVLSLLSVPVMMIAVYGFWKKRHVGSYSICRSPARPWRAPPGRPEPPWKPAWFKATYGVGELFPEGPQEVTEVKMGTCLDWSQVGG